jgi:hypothetical protein
MQKTASEGAARSVFCIPHVSLAAASRQSARPCRFGGCHLKALGLVDVQYTKNTGDGMSVFLSLTPKGEKVMMQERIIKK